MSHAHQQVNITKLPEAEEINFGDYLLIENDLGTQIIKFDNFIISEENITFHPLLSAHTTGINFNLTQIKSLTGTQDILNEYFEKKERGIGVGGDALVTLSAIGIGHTNPDAKLTIDGNLSASGSLSASGVGGGYNYFENRVGIGTSSPTCDLEVGVGDVPGRSMIKAVATTENSYLVLDSDRGMAHMVNKDDSTFRINHSNTSDDAHLVILESGNIGLGTTAPQTSLHIGGSGTLGMVEAPDHPVMPTAGTEVFCYVKADKFIIKFNEVGYGVRYKYLVLSGDRVTWVQTLTAP